MLFENIAKNSEKEVYIDRIIKNGLYLDDHAERGLTELKIKEMKWDYVILQGCGSNTAYPDYFTDHPVLPALEKLKNKILENCESTKIVFCLPWAFEDGMTWYQDWTDTYQDMQIKILYNTINYSDFIGFQIAPVGWSWYKVLEEKNYPLHYLHMADWNHPNLKGSYLMACVIYSTIFQENLIGNSYYSSLSEEEAIYFQNVASYTVMENLELWKIIDKEIVFVDDNNTDGPWEGTFEKPYNKIQDGINKISENGRIYVFNGIYYENIHINHSISIKGEDKNNTIINGDGEGKNNTISINNDNISIEEFTITNGKKGIYINNSYNIEISKNIIKENMDGIYLHNSYNNTLNNNFIENCSGSGIYLFKSDNQTIINNTITNCKDIIYLQNSYNNTLNNNFIENCSGSGIYLFKSNNQKIINNTITNCTNGIYLEESSDNNLTFNQIIDNQKGVFCSYTINNKINRNNFLYNEENAKFTKYFHKDFLKPNNWNNNYWDDWFGLRFKIIPGIMYIPNSNLIGFFIPWIEIDLKPAIDPY